MVLKKFQELGFAEAKTIGAFIAGDTGVDFI
jgi:hypothetical protein